MFKGKSKRKINYIHQMNFKIKMPRGIKILQKKRLNTLKVPSLARKKEKKKFRSRYSSELKRESFATVRYKHKRKFPTIRRFTIRRSSELSYYLPSKFMPRLSILPPHCTYQINRFFFPSKPVALCRLHPKYRAKIFILGKSLKVNCNGDFFDGVYNSFIKCKSVR